MSLCTLEPFTQSLPINCNLVAYRLTTGASDAPVVTIRRADVEMPVATTVVSTMSNVWMDVPVSRLCDGVTVNEVRPTSYSVLELSLSGVQVGDQLLVDGYGNGTIDAVTTGACPVPYAPECNGTEAIDCSAYETEPTEDDSVGCDARPGTSGYLVAAVLLGLVLVRPRRSRA